MLIELFCAFILAGAPAQADSAPGPAVQPAPATAGAETAMRDLDISGGWKRRDDPRDAGIIGKWHTPKTDDSRWESASNPWEAPSIPAPKKGKSRDRRASSWRYWLRNTVSIPAGAPSRIFLSLSHPGDSLDAYINGVLLVKDLPGGVPAIREVILPAGAGGEFLLAMRVKGTRTGTGRGSARVIMSGESRPLFTGIREWVMFLAKENPALAWPAWAAGRPIMGAPVGLPGSTAPAYVGGEGQLVPPDRSCVVSCWIYEPATKKFYSPGFQKCAFSLDERILPIPEVTVPMGRFNMYLRFWADSMEDDPNLTLVVGEVTVANASDRTRQVELFIAVHPLLPWEEAGSRGGFLSMTTVEHDPIARTILVDGKPAVVLTTPADSFIAAPFTEGTVARLAASGEPGPSRAEDNQFHMASGAAVYRLKIQPFGARTMTYRVFLSGAPAKASAEYTQAIRDINRKWSQKENLNEWRRLLVGKERFFLRIPDKRAQEAFYASIGHLLAGSGAGKRADAGLLASALEQAGHNEFAVKIASSSPSSSMMAVPEPEPLAPGRFRPAVFIRGMGALSATDPVMSSLLMDKSLKKMAAPAAFAWGEVEDEATGRWSAGEMPSLAASAEYILAMRGMLVREGADFVELAPAVPPAWLKPGNQVEIKNAPTKFGILSYAVTARESGFVVNLNDAPSAPGGCRWRVPGKKRIAKLVMDGRAADIPADRLVAIPAGVKRVAVIW